MKRIIKKEKFIPKYENAVHGEVNTRDKALKNYAAMKKEALFQNFDTSEKGLTSMEARTRIENTGKNVIITENKNTLLNQLKEAVINPFNIILLVIAAVTFFTDVVMSITPDYLTVFIILLLVSVSGIIAFVQNRRSDNAAEKLIKMISNKASVWRDGKLIEIPIDEIVIGDIVKFTAGDMIPADVCFLTTKDTFVSQAALTGESNPVEKFSKAGLNAEASMTDLQNIGFMGSNIISGSATAIVIATGNDTYFGSVAESLSGDRAQTSFERGVNSVSIMLVRMMLVIVPIVALINIFTKAHWTVALLFSASIAVGLTPEMLPVIMTSTLARGAISMSKQDVIVRNLSSIQAFGEMDILCTDKTGTLTEDKVVLEKYINLHGEDDKRVLRHAYLNSRFQTGLKNLIDHAIVNRGQQYGLEELLSKYVCVDEIPFDFTRRRMSVVLQDKSGKRQLITKGAVEEMIEISSFIEIDGEVIPMDEETKKVAMETCESYNAEGLRMIAVAQKNNISEREVFGVKDEKNMVLIGFVGFLDPPKESARDAIKALKEHGVRTVVLTGDNEGVSVKVCNKVGVDTSISYTGADIDQMDDNSLKNAIKSCDLFSKLSPNQKERVVRALQESGHTVGFMGDGINDAPALREADVGISVDSGVDIAKESADIILLKKDLMVLEKGVIEGRRTFGNIIKYIKMAVSGNFGNMISVIVASFFLPFLPMLPLQILTQNLLCDFSQIGIPFDVVDEEYLKIPRKWETASIKSFMWFMGPLSSIFDILCFAVLWWALGFNTLEKAPLFQGGWFVFGTVSQILVIYMIRTEKIPFLQSKPAKPLLISTVIVAFIVILIGFTDIAVAFDMMRLPAIFLLWLLLILLGYLISTQLVKKIYIRKYGSWM